jgi:DNA polymerase epsilon subunit 1
MYLKNNRPRVQKRKQQVEESEEKQAENNLKRAIDSNAKNDKIDTTLGFKKYEAGEMKIGWLVNFKTTSVVNEDDQHLSAIEYYFVEENGGTFKVTKDYEPYFYIGTKPGMEQQVEQYLSKQYTTRIAKMVIVEKEDLDLVCIVIVVICHT